MRPVKHRFLGSMHRSEMWLHLQRLVVILLMVSSSIAQTFQYSRGWTNGKRSFPISQVTCQLQRLKAMLQGKSLPPSHLLCDLYRTFEEDLKLEHLDKSQPRVSLSQGEN